MENFISWLLLSKSDICFQPKTVWYIAIISKLCECVCVCVCVCVCYPSTNRWAELQLLIEVGGFNPHVLSFFLAACMAFIISKAVALSHRLRIWSLHWKQPKLLVSWKKSQLYNKTLGSWSSVSLWLGRWHGAITTPFQACFPYPVKELNHLHSPVLILCCFNWLVSIQCSSSQVPCKQCSSSAFFIFPHLCLQQILISLLCFGLCVRC